MVPRAILISALTASCVWVSTAQACLKYDPAVVTLKGLISIVQAYGPPGFGDDPEHDSKEVYNQLTLQDPVCIDHGRDELEPTVTKAVNFQLSFAFSGMKSFSRDLVGKPVVVTGKLFHAVTGHHHTEM